MNRAEKATLAGVFLNAVLFAIKFSIGILSNSLALLSDAFNSLGDIISYTAIHISVKIGHKKADKDHPFGHHRAEPIAGFVVSLLTFLLAFEVMKNAFVSLFSPRVYSYQVYAFLALAFTVFVKLLMYYFYDKIGKKENSPALRAGAADSRNDVLISSIAIAGVAGPYLGMPLLDSIAAIIISMYIFYSAYSIGKENVDFLMGKTLPEKEIAEIKRCALKIRGVKGINDLRAHYVGNYAHVEVHIEVDKKMTTEDSHTIGKEVQHAVERLHFIDKAFIHVDPV